MKRSELKVMLLMVNLGWMIKRRADDVECG